MDIFETSVKMSTYLVAFIVSDFEYVESGKQRVYSRPDSIKNGDANFALDVAITILDELEEYTGVPYSLEKMYQASIPQFSAGAMENWGLVTYRETALLFNKTTTTTGSKQSIEVVIAHEYTHQWFGDLVGPQWWSYLWLNEGFASYLQYIIGGKVTISHAVLVFLSIFLYHAKVIKFPYRCLNSLLVSIINLTISIFTLLRSSYTRHVF